MTEKRKRGRPRKAEGDLLTTRLDLHMTAAQYATLEADAAAGGITVQELARRRLFDAPGGDLAAAHAAGWDACRKRVVELAVRAFPEVAR